MTPPENNVPSDPIRPPVIPNKGANSDDHQGCIDMSNDDTDDDTVPKREVIIAFDSDDDTVEDSVTTIVDNKNEGLHKKGFVIVLTGLTFLIQKLFVKLYMVRTLLVHTNWLQ